MKPFLGLFANWDVVTRQKPPGFLERFFTTKSDSEIFIPEKLHSRILSSLANPERMIGGNAANAAVTLSELGFACVLSCPVRPRKLMSELSKHKIFLILDGKERPPLSCTRKDEEPEHIIFEMDDLKEGGKAAFGPSYRKIFNYDKVQLDFLLDGDFWDSVKNTNYLFLSGFHTVPKRHRKKVNEIADFLEKRKCKVHLELGYGKGLMGYAIKKLLNRNCIDSLGMNETELKALGISGTNLVLKEKMLSFLERTSLERMSLHTREYRLSVFRKNPERNGKAVEFSIQACAAKALGGIRENMEKAKSVPRSAVKTWKGDNFFMIPTRIVEKPKIIVGLGDAAAVTDSFYALKK
jgi:ADP-dependent phosphofructokinase/glucokinase